MQPSDSVLAWDHHPGSPVLCSAQVSALTSPALTWQLGMPASSLRRWFKCSLRSLLPVPCLTAACPIVFAPIINGRHLLHLFEKPKISIQ